MSNERQETVADIVAEMRKDIAEGTVGIWSDFGGEIARSYADRIEAAHKREREATTEKSSAVGNADIVREVAQEMLNTSMQAVSAERINGWATRLAAACEQTVTNCNQLGNAAKMREALSDACYAMFNFLKTQNGGYEEMAKALDKAKAALATHPRNCDVGTADGQAQRFKKFCYIYPLNCSGCPFKNIANTHNECAIFWLQMPYKEGGEK